jgi:phage terminase small subunit
MKPKRLTAQQEAFCQAYVKAKGKRGAASNAYRTAYNTRMKADGVASAAKRLLRQSPIRLRIAEIEQERESDPAVQVAEDTPKDTGLTLEQERFCQHYALHFNAAEAYGEAFVGSRKWKPQSRAEVASKLLANNAKIKSRIEALRAKVIAAAEKKFEISVDRCLAEYARMGFANMADYVVVQADGTARLDLNNVDRDGMAAIQEMTFETVMSADPDALDAAGVDKDDDRKKVPVLKCKFKLHDKKGPVDSIMKHLGGFEKDNKQKGEAEAAALKEGLPDNRDVARAVLDILRGAVPSTPAAPPEPPSPQQEG